MRMTTVFGVLVTAAALLALLWALQRRLMYFPTADVLTPSQVGLDGDLQAVTFPTSDGLMLNGWFVDAVGPSPRGVVLVFNGNAGNRSYRAPLAAALRDQGFHVLLFDYRGYGGNPGAPAERGLAADSRAARRYLEARADIDPSRIVYFGESLGTAVAIDLAVEHPPAALVLRSPFTSMVDLGRHHYPFLPVGLFLRDRFAAIERIARIRAPVLVIAGARDRIVPVEYTRRLYDAVRAPKTIVILPAADHNDYELLAGDEMIEAIRQFLQPFR
jgi:fermentation-respiration switch protein FrsA (DUF1100 family)